MREALLELGNHFLDVVVTHRVHHLVELQTARIPGRELRPHVDVQMERERLARLLFLGMRMWFTDRMEPALLDHLARRFGQEPLGDLRSHLASEALLDHPARHFALSEAGQGQAPAQILECRRVTLLDLGVGHLHGHAPPEGVFLPEVLHLERQPSLVERLVHAFLTPVA